MKTRLVTLLIVLLGINLIALADDSPESTVDRYFQAYSDMDVEGMLDVYAPDAVFSDILQRHRVEGSEALRTLLSGLVAVHSKMSVRIQRKIASGNRVAVEFVYAGRLSGEALRQLTGKTQCRDVDYEIPATSWFRIDNGHIVEQTDFIDVTTLAEVKAKAAGASH